MTLQFDRAFGADSGVEVSTVAALVAATADVAVLIDDMGVVRDILAQNPENPIEESTGWRGRPWLDTVTSESRSKVQEMLAEAATNGVSRRRQVNHPSAAGPDVPVAYTAVRIGSTRRVLVVGRDLRGVSLLQQRLVEAQQSLERDYWRMRHIETRYRLLFQVSSEPVVVLDAGTRKIVEANPAAAKLLDTTAKRLLGRPFPPDPERSTEKRIQEHLATVRERGRADAVQVQVGGNSVWLSASLVRQEDSALFLVRMTPTDVPGGVAAPMGAAPAIELIERMPDGFVLLDFSGTALMVNRAFLDMAELATEEQARGQSLQGWLGRPGADLGVLLGTLREHGVVRLFSTVVRGQLGSSTEVEVSGVAIPNAEIPCIGLTIRDVGRRLAAGPRGARDLTLAVEQLTQLVGRVSLRKLVRDTTDLVERHFVEAALELTQDNRTGAAEVLGVSRQSLYSKLRRYKLGGPSTS